MNMSPEISALAKALSQAQKEMGAAKKTADNPYFKSSYADLSEVFNAIREPLTKNGLSIVQAIDPDPEYARVETILFHESGQWISSMICLKPVKGDPQGMGSAITYGRRYSLSAIVGIASEEEDDGNEASKPKGKPVVDMPKKKTLSVSEAFTMPTGTPFDLEAKYVDVDYGELTKEGKKISVTNFQVTSGAVPMEITLFGGIKLMIEKGDLLIFRDVKAASVNGEKKFHALKVEKK